MKQYFYSGVSFTDTIMHFSGIWEADTAEESVDVTLAAIVENKKKELKSDTIVLVAMNNIE